MTTTQHIEDIYPLSPLQQGMLYQTLYAPDDGLYIERLKYTIKGSLNRTAFEQAWIQIIRRHPILRTAFAWEDLAEPHQIVLQEIPLPLQYIDWRDYAPDQQSTLLTEHIQACRFSPFDMSKAPLMDLTLIQTAEDSYEFIWRYHHILLDGWSVPLILSEVFVLYESYDRGEDLILEPSRDYRDYIMWLLQQDLSVAEDYWRQQLAGFTTPTSLRAIQRQTEPSADDEDELKLRLSETATEQLQAFARQHHLTVNTVIQGAWALLLSRYSGEADVLYGVVSSGRPTELSGAETMVGLLMNTTPVRVKVPPDALLIPWLQDLQAQQIEARQYEYSPLMAIQGWSELPRGTSLFDSMVVFENPSMGRSNSQQNRKASLDIQDSVHYGGAINGFPLTLIVKPESQLLLHFTYDIHNFETSAINQLAGHLQNLLEVLIHDSSKCLAHIPVLTANEQKRILVDWNNTKTTYPSGECVHTLFEAQVKRQPDAIALAFNDEHMTYDELNKRANQLAHYLQCHGVGPEDVVGLAVDRSIEMIVGLLAIFKAGGAYVPLDPAYPSERLDYMLVNAQVSLLLTQAHLMPRFTALASPQTNRHIIQLDSDWDEISQQPNGNPTSQVTPANLAYIIYTSGSTGLPKGTLLQHQGLTNFISGFIDQLNVTADDQVLQFASLSFDASLSEIFSSLLTGATLHLASNTVLLSVVDLTDLLRKQAISVAVLPPSLLLILSAEQLPDLQTLVSTGEACPPEIISSWATDRYFFNGYGPTEVTIGSTTHLIDKTTDQLTNVPIGKPLANYQNYVLDDALQPVPVGATGEIYIGGVSLARGYLNQPELTAEKFVPHPFGDQPGARLYKTGDLAHYLANGNIAFTGRVGRQIKLRGQRIELDEIEVALRSHSAIQEAVVMHKTGVNANEHQIIGYFVTVQDQAITTDILRNDLNQILPVHMVPARLIQVDAIPRTPNGKVDRQALPEPDTISSNIAEDPDVVGSPIAEVLKQVWANIFKIERVSGYDNFFDLGGHSLLAMQLISRINQTFQVNLPMRTLFEASTLDALAIHIEALIQGKQDPSEMPIVPISRNRELPLSFAQQRLWFVDQLEPGNAAYNIPVAVRLHGTLNTTAFEQSLKQLIDRHESLRTRFDMVDGQPIQLIETAVDLPIKMEYLTAASVDVQSLQVQQLAAQEAQQGFDLKKAPLFRVTLLQLNADEYVVLMTMHHIISDEWSMNVLIQELATLYAANCVGREASLPELPIQYADYAAWQRQWLSDEVYAQHLAYWQGQLSGKLSPLTLPLDHARPEKSTYAGALHPFTLPMETSSKLVALSRIEAVTLFMTLLASLQTFLFRYTNQPDIIIGTDVTHRNRLELEGLIGFFVNHLLLRGDLSGNPTFRTVLKRVRETTLGAYAHQDLPYDRLVSALQPDRKTDHAPLFQILFVYGNPTGDTVEVPNLKMAPISADFVLAKYDLTLFMSEGEHGIQGVWRYRTELYDANTIHQLTEQFITLLSSIVINPDMNVHRLTMMTEAEQEQTNQTARERRQRKSKRRRTVRRKAVELSVEA